MSSKYLQNVSRSRLMLSNRATDLFKAEKIGVSLGPGLPIGLVDIGFLIALEQLKIPISLMSGTSMGAAVGALYASGMPPVEIRDVVVEMFAKDKIRRLLISDRKIPLFGPSSADQLIAELINLTKWDPEFHELRIPFFVVVSDKAAQRSVILRHGKVFDAVKASLAIPFLVSKKKQGRMKLADGAIFSPVHVEALYSEGADFVIGIQAKPVLSDHKRKIPFSTIMKPVLLRAAGWKTSKEIFFAKPECDILLRPRVPRYLARDGNNAGDIIKLGIKITYEAVHEIEKGNYPKVKVAASQDRKFNTNETGIQLEKNVSTIESYLNKLEQKTENLSDAELMEEFPKFAKELQNIIDTFAQIYSYPDEAAQALKDKFKNLMHFINQSPFLNRALHKPLGYAGDYQMMNYIYNNELFEASGNAGKLLNYFVFSSPETNAVRNRAKIIQGIVQHKVAQSSSVCVSSIACGPAREVTETMKMISEYSDKVKITWTLLDQDKQALDNARAGIPNDQRLDIRYINSGVRDLIKKNIDLGKQDIIYSLGLFDYLDDKTAIILIKRFYSMLNPGGLLLIGNFQPNTPLRIFREGIIEWFLICRTEDELLKLGKAGAPEGRHFVIAEPSGVNLILVTSKPLASDI